MCLQKGFKPLDAFDVEVVGGLVKQEDVGLLQQELGQFKLGKGTSVAYDLVTDAIKFQNDDFYMRDQSKATIGLIESDELLNAVEAAVGEL